MHKFLGVAIAVAAMAIPGLAQVSAAPKASLQDTAYQWNRDRRSSQLSPDDQQKFNSYYQRWQQYRATNNRDEMNSMQDRMWDIYSHYNIPRSVPFGEVASGNAGYRGDHDRDDYRDNGRVAQSRLSPSDQQKFDSYYQRWLQYRSTNNRDQMNSMQDRMWDIYSHYSIPRNVPFDQVANGGYRR
jgi:hypothetical protein